MEHTFKEKGGFLVKKKSKRMENVLTGVLVAVLLIASGFMGIDIDGFLHEIHVERIPKTFHGMAVRVFR